ncbi:hypothetical protein ONE63_009137 [Megalurothrips usitatus]|uniref:Probable deoxycytidylate deaminase n=1 Tax=Megalurothrips usitatus TaxID=439358 RepID=A0AAV7XNE9_9NEOP|nr:hypothetical protein ONE63_009137 [Megalurothrips usitatus]
MSLVTPSPPATTNISDRSADGCLAEEISTLTVEDRNLTKRTDYIGWDSYFMAISCLVSKRSKDPATQVGACIVNRKNRIVGQGYNGMPRGCSDDEFPWDKTSSNPTETKYFYVCHAEMNAVFNKNCADISNCVLYSLLFPCNQCAKTIIQSGISEVVYMGDKNMNKPEATASKRMFEASGVTVRQFRPLYDVLKINFKSGKCEECLPNTIPPEDMNRDLSKKREHCLPWDDYFMAISILVAKRSKCPTLQRGACIVNQEKCIIGQGYNGMPHGCSDDEFPWRSDSDSELDNKYLYECHAVLNAILNAGVNVKGCVVYSTTFPCNECTKAIIQSGIRKVVYLQTLEMEPRSCAALRMLNAVGITYRQHIPVQDELFVDFTLIDA